MKKNNTRADSAEWQRLYKTARWRRVRERVLNEQPLCQWCLEREIVTVANEVHHVEPHKGDMVKFWSGPFVATCKSCHSRRGQREDLGQETVRFGPDGWPT